LHDAGVVDRVVFESGLSIGDREGANVLFDLQHSRALPARCAQLPMAAAASEISSMIAN